MKLLAALVLTAAAAAAADVQSWTRRGNVTAVALSQGIAEIEWLSSSTFRFQRCPFEVCPSRAPAAAAVEFSLRETDAALEFETAYLRVDIRKTGSLVRVEDSRGRLLMDELAPANPAAFARVSPRAEKLAGLGVRAARAWDLRGSLVRTTKPLVLSSEGFGQYFPIAGVYDFDLARANPGMVTVSSPSAARLEYYFYYGPTFKEMLEEHLRVRRGVPSVSVEHLEIREESRLPPYAAPVQAASPGEIWAVLGHAAFSGILAPAVEAGSAPPDRLALLPVLYAARPPDPALVAQRAAWISYLYTYLEEARDRGLPVFRPLAFQFPKDAETWRTTDTFMIGDELLLATAPRAYLPAGIWTDFCSGAVYPGRRWVEQDFPCPLARNGTIVPVDRPPFLELHYFPRLAAEFFLSEPSGGPVTQIHAAPAGELLRLQIESRVARTYEWVVHHVSRPLRWQATNTTVPASDVRYDPARRQLRVRLAAPAGSDLIVHFTLGQPLE